MHRRIPQEGDCSRLPVDFYDRDMGAKGVGVARQRVGAAELQSCLEVWRQTCLVIGRGSDRSKGYDLLWVPAIEDPPVLEGHFLRRTLQEVHGDTYQLLARLLEHGI